MGPDTVLAARDLVKEYVTGNSKVVALAGVSLDVPRGAFMAVMGPSGSGKSTLLHLLGGLDAPTSGEVLLEGLPTSALSDKELTLARRHKIGFVFQFFNLVPVLTVEENIALPAIIDA
ncbi:MAG: ABC transporter ATP-binding protein, partial [Actinomycetota bacterium]